MKMLNNLKENSGTKNLRRNKKAQTGGTLTWFVATIIIIFILLIAVYAASILGKTKHLDFSSDKLDSSDENWIETKNNLAFEKDSTNKEKIKKWLVKDSFEEDS